MKKEELLKRTKKELLALAAEKGTRLSARLRKAELVDQILSLLSPRSRGRGGAKAKEKVKKAVRKQKARPARGPLKAARRRKPRTGAPEPLSADELRQVSDEISREFPLPFEQSEVVLLGVDPFHAHAFWHVRLEEVESARSSLGPEGANAALILRFYDVTLIDFDSAPAHAFFDVAAHSLQSNFYIDFWESGRSWIVDIGLRTDDGRFHTLARSNHIELPPHAPSRNYDRSGIVVDPAVNLICEVADITRAETLADIRPEPRPDMAPETSDDLVRSFYRQLTDQTLGETKQRGRRRKRAPLHSGTRPGTTPSAGSTAGTTPRPEDQSRSAPSRTPPDGQGSPSDAEETPPPEVGTWPKTVATQTGPVTYRATLQPVPLESRRFFAESSYGFYEAGRQGAAVSSWVTSPGGVSSWVTSPGAWQREETPLEKVLVLPGLHAAGGERVAGMSAELVIQGRAEPGAPLSFFGEPVRLRPDGTFLIRKRLAEGTMIVPLAQRAGPDETPDGEEGRS